MQAYKNGYKLPPVLIAMENAEIWELQNSYNQN